MFFYFEFDLKGLKSTADAFSFEIQKHANLNANVLKKSM